MVLEDENICRNFPNIKCCLLKVHIGFIFQEPSECNVSDIREVYANWKADAYSLYVTVWGVEAPLTPTVLNKLLWTVNRHSDVLTGIYISSLYQDIGHNLCGAQSIAKWI